MSDGKRCREKEGEPGEDERMKDGVKELRRGRQRLSLMAAVSMPCCLIRLYCDETPATELCLRRFGSDMTGPPSGSKYRQSRQHLLRLGHSRSVIWKGWLRYRSGPSV